jgi:predicted SnoaL-like aldol condensation-catalyzing enzyme
MRIRAMPDTPDVADIAVLRDLFDRWERVWHEGRLELVPLCVAPRYIRHDEMGDRALTRESYIAELTKLRHDRPDVRVDVYDYLLQGDAAWYRFTMTWTDRSSGEKRSRAGMQTYRVENGLLAETWVILQPPGSAWNDPVAQESWTSPRLSRAAK